MPRLAACLVASFVVRAPGLSRTLFNPDEAFVSTQARVLVAGGRLYRDAVDRKPPLLPYLSAAVFEVTGSHSIVLLRLVAVVAHGLTAALLASECRRRFGRTTALPAAGLYLLASVAMAPTDAQAFNGEAIVALATTAALVAASRRRPSAAGFAVAAALLTRQTALLLLPGIAVAVVRSTGRAALVRLLAPALVVVPIVAALVGWRDMWFWCLGGGSAGYMALPNDAGYTMDLARMSALTLLAGSVALVAVLPWALARWRSELDLWVLLAGGVAASVVGLRFFGHYNLQLLPALTLVAMSGWALVPRGGGRAVLVGIALVPAALHYQEAVVRARRSLPEDDVVASVVRASTRPGDRIFVWGHVPEYYVTANRLPATRFLETGFLTGHSGGRPPDQGGLDLAVPGAWQAFEADLRQHAPTLIIDASSAGIRSGRYYRPSMFPRFARILHEHYRRFAVVDGMDLYQRRAT